MFPSLAKCVRRRRILQRVANLAQCFRIAGYPVVHSILQTKAGAGPARPNSYLNYMMCKNPRLDEQDPASAVDPQVRPEASDIMCARSTGLTAFHATGLASLLRGLKVQTIVLVGVSSDIAIPGATIEAVNHGFNVIVAEDCTAGSSAAVQQYAMTRLLPLLATVTTARSIEIAISAAPHRST